jgi:hypothetical protein
MRREFQPTSSREVAMLCLSLIAAPALAVLPVRKGEPPPDLRNFQAQKQ